MVQGFREISSGANLIQDDESQGDGRALRMNGREVLEISRWFESHALSSCVRKMGFGVSFTSDDWSHLQTLQNHRLSA